MQDTGPENGKNAGWYEARMPGVLAQLLPLGRLPGALARLANTWTAPGALARLADTWTGAWGSGSVYLEKVPAFFYFAGTFFDAKPIETHRALFTA